MGNVESLRQDDRLCPKVGKDDFERHIRYGNYDAVGSPNSIVGREVVAWLD